MYSTLGVVKVSVVFNTAPVELEPDMDDIEKLTDIFLMYSTEFRSEGYEEYVQRTDSKN